MISFKALSILLTYPSADLQAAIPEIRQALLKEGLLGPRRMAALEPLLRTLSDKDIYDLQEDYVLLFDRSRSLSLVPFRTSSRRKPGPWRRDGQSSGNLP